MKKNNPSLTQPRRRIVPDRGSISGSGEGMSDAEALAILRKKESPSARENPDIEVVVKTEPPKDQTELPMELPGYTPIEGWSKAVSTYKNPSLSDLSYYLEKLTPDLTRIAIDKADLNSPLGSILDQTSAIRLAEQVWGKGESLRMRLLLDRSTIDLDLPKGDSDALEATIHDLIDRSLD